MRRLGRILSRFATLRTFTPLFDWFVSLSLFVLIGLRNYFGNSILKPLQRHSKKRNVTKSERAINFGKTKERKNSAIKREKKFKRLILHFPLWMRPTTPPHMINNLHWIIRLGQPYARNGKSSDMIFRLRIIEGKATLN